VTSDATDTIWQWRRVSGWEYRFVAKHLGWSPVTRLAALEAGVATPTQEELDALAGIYGCEPADLLRPPSRDFLRRAIGGFPPGFTIEEVAVIRHALRVAVEHGSVEQRHIESIERKLVCWAERERFSKGIGVLRRRLQPGKARRPEEN
jgi:hypothetical protein